MTFRAGPENVATRSISLLLFVAFELMAAPAMKCDSSLHAVPATQTCEALAFINLPGAAIASAQTMPPGTFTPPAHPAQMPNVYATLPVFCRVTATLQPASDSKIRIEVWMPVSGWNGKFQAVGNSGWGGTINYNDLAVALASGYATASTDTGHNDTSAAFGLGHPTLLIDYSYRAIHEMTVQAKAIINAYYGNEPRLSIFSGCSYGGHQAQVEALRYPADYDGIVAGDPSLNWIRLHVARIATFAFVHRSDESYIPPSKYPALHEAVLQACDALDGVKDGIIEDPTRCHFDPEVLEYKSADGPDCLTSAQVETARALYSPVKDPRTGKKVQPQMVEPGSELSWSVLAGPRLMATPLTEYLKSLDPSWDGHRFNPASDFDTMLRANVGLVDLDDANLAPLKTFFDRGGKLLMYHGWADASVPPLDSVEYFQTIVKQLGEGVVGKSVQLYMIPGMYHCGGGPGTDTFDKTAVIEDWLVRGAAPDKIIASHLTSGRVDRTRPLCPYGEMATYKGSGSIDQAGSFICAVPR
jgi:feruloyl esterase